MCKHKMEINKNADFYTSIIRFRDKSIAVSHSDVYKKRDKKMCRKFFTLKNKRRKDP